MRLANGSKTCTPHRGHFSGCAASNSRMPASSAGLNHFAARLCWWYSSKVIVLTFRSSRPAFSGRLILGVGPQSFAELFNVIGALPFSNILNPVRGFTCCRYVPSKPAASGIASHPVPFKRQHFFPRNLPLQPVQHFASPGQRPNNSFKPTPFRRGLIQALGRTGSRPVCECANTVRRLVELAC